MMNESYAEAGAKRGKTAGSALIKGGLITLIVISVLLGPVFLGSLSVILATIIALAAFYIFPRLEVEYEYVYCDGQLDFDKISGNAKRKTMLRIDFEKVEMMAPVNSHALDNYNHMTLVKKDYTSQKPDAKVYAIICRTDKDTLKILFEPSDKMLACIKQKTPRKLSEY